jgi:hypothetical protein
MRLPPLSVIVTWPTPNYVNPATHGDALLIVNLIFITLVVAAVVGRFYARLVIKKWFGWDDSMIALALVSYRQHYYSCQEFADVCVTAVHHRHDHRSHIGESSIRMELA